MTRERGRTLHVGAVVQIDPQHDDVFGGCFMQVTEPKPWGAQGVVLVPGKGRAYYRAPFSALVFIGYAEWIVADGECEEEAASPAIANEVPADDE